ncbi:MAG: ZIP family metal transporter, partial [Bacillota bacterium]
LTHGAVWVVASGFLVGGCVIWAADTFVPHVHVKDAASMARTGLLIAAGIALHNLPEGLAVGAGYGDNVQSGAAIAAAIGLHNIPEGMAMSLPMLAGGIGFWPVVAIATFAGLVTPIGAVIGSWFAHLSPTMLAFSLAFAAGAMVYITSDELIPLSHKDGHSHFANAGVMIGFLVAALMG